MRFRRRLTPEARVDLIPMIDVVFQLVVFFMVSSTFMLTPGIKLALPQRQVIAYVGDGAYLMSNQGLWTAARYNIPVNIIVCNNRLYKAVRDSAVRFNGKAVEKNHFIGSSIDNPAPDLAKIAEGFGVPAFTISDPGEIKPILEKTLNSGGPSVIEVIIDK